MADPERLIIDSVQERYSKPAYCGLPRAQLGHLKKFRDTPQEVIKKQRLS